MAPIFQDHPVNPGRTVRQVFEILELRDIFADE